MFSKVTKTLFLLIVKIKQSGNKRKFVLHLLLCFYRQSFPETNKNLNIILLCIIIGELILYGGVGWRWLENFYDEGGRGWGGGGRRMKVYFHWTEKVGHFLSVVLALWIYSFSVCMYRHFCGVDRGSWS